MAATAALSNAMGSVDEVSTVMNGTGPAGLAPPQSKRSLYQICQLLKRRLMHVPGMEEYLSQADAVYGSTAAAGGRSDPVSELWRLFRLGSSLCALYNAYRPDHVLPTVHEVNPNINACKKCVYRFISACQSELKIPSEELFSISELYQDDTNGFVRVVQTVQLVMDRIGVPEADEDIDSGGVSAGMGSSELPSLDPSRSRGKVVHELLVTDQTYVSDMELLQRYMRDLRKHEIFSADEIHLAFSNLDSLVDFQRKFLIGLEARTSVPWDEQHLGRFFTLMETGFSMYEPFCTNHSNASDLVVERAAELAKLETRQNDAAYELHSLLIKPIQRICKYPLFLKEIIRNTNEDDPQMAELQDGLASIMRVVSRINETRRRQENQKVIEDLEKRIDDWKGHSIEEFGDLLLMDQFSVYKGDMEREYSVYLFEAILLCCKEIQVNRKPSRGISIAKKNKKRTSLQLKGRIYVSNIEGVEILSMANYTLQVTWYGDVRDDSMILRCRNEEHLKQWFTAISNLVDSTRETMSSMQSSRKISDTEFVSMQRVSDPRGSLASFSDTTETDEMAEDSMSFAGSVSMSRNASQTSQKSRNAVGDAMPNLAQIYPWSASGTNGSMNKKGMSTAQLVSSPYPPGVYPVRSISSRSNPGDSVPPMVRSLSKESAGSGHYAQSPPLMRPHYPPILVRERSASSPNIHTSPPPRIGSGPHHYPQHYHHPHGAPINTNRSVSASQSAMSGAEGPAPTGAASLGKKIRMQLICGEDMLLIMVSRDLNYPTLYDRVYRKLRLCGHARDDSRPRLRYMDEDGDMITLASDEDLAMAFETFEAESQAPGGVYRLYID